ncbi:hypothetical protein MMC17_007796 [Xylographa soralifera]|nr:hypothetical protein [Xylographa soralifera]
MQSFIHKASASHSRDHKTREQWRLADSTSRAYGSGFKLDTNDYNECDNIHFTFVPCPYMDLYDQYKRPRYCDSIFVAIDGACRGNGTPFAQSAIGVYFGKSSKYNISSTILKVDTTNQIAELMACLTALRRIVGMNKANTTLIDGLDNPLSQVVIKTDSEYTVKGMTDWILKWRTNGYKNSNGGPVKNAGLFKAVDETVNQLDSGVNVRF